MKLKVNEIFTTFQGEGTSIGMPVTFLRLAVCNLHCVWCDTWYTWNFGKGDGVEKRFGSPTVKMADEVHEMDTVAVAKRLAKLQTKNLVISGGEPMLQQKNLMELFEFGGLRNHYLKHVEIETNGTIPLVPGFIDNISQINCSPKLENSGNSKVVRFKLDVLKQYLDTGKAWFKFVVTSEKDLDEVKEIVKEVEITPDRVILMPQGKTKDEQEVFQEKTAALAAKCGWRFTPRLHILLYGTKRGV